jgi:hypothetical protein
MLYRLDFEGHGTGFTGSLVVEAPGWSATQDGARLPAGLVPFAVQQGAARGARVVAVGQFTPVKVGPRGCGRAAHVLALGSWECV